MFRRDNISFGIEFNTVTVRSFSCHSAICAKSVCVHARAHTVELMKHRRKMTVTLQFDFNLIGLFNRIICHVGCSQRQFIRFSNELKVLERMNERMNE